MKPTPTSAEWYPKQSYHHRNLRSSALVRGREIVATFGPQALTMRGLARELGVSATALVHWFGNVASLRSAVAASVLEKVGEACGTPAHGPSEIGGGRDGRLPEIGTAWIAFAAK